MWFDGSDYFGVGVDGELYERSNFATLMNDDLLASAVDGCGWFIERADSNYIVDAVIDLDVAPHVILDSDFAVLENTQSGSDKYIFEVKAKGVKG